MIDKQKIIDGKNYVPVYNTSKMKYELSEVFIERAWFFSKETLLCRLSNGWVVVSDYLYSNKKARNQKILMARFNFIFLDKRNYYLPEEDRQKIIQGLFISKKKDYRSFFVSNRV